MIGRLVWASIRQRAGRSALLLGGYALGVGVTIVLLSVGEAMVEQARDAELLGGGHLIVLPAGIDLETLRTGGTSSMYFSVAQAPLLYREVLAGTRFRDRIAAAAPWIDGELVYLEVDTALVPVSAGGAIPSLAERLGAGPDVVAGAWDDAEADDRWREPGAAEFYRSIDAMHLPGAGAAGDTTWAEWHYFNVLLPDSGWLYLTYMVAGDVPDGRWEGRVLANRVDVGAGADGAGASGAGAAGAGAAGAGDAATRAYSVTVGPGEVVFEEGRPDLAIGESSVAIGADGEYRVRTRAPAEDGGPPLVVDLAVSERSRRHLPPVELGNRDFASGYVAPLLDGRASGRVCEGGRCEELEGARAYHDHNWGTWSMVTWDWGQAAAGPYSVLYGGVARDSGGTGAPSQEAPTSAAAHGGRFLYLADEHGFAGVFDIREIATRWPGEPGRGLPEGVDVTAVNGPDSLTLSVEVGHARATPVPVAQGGGDALFYQMRGNLELSGRLGGANVAERGDGFFETWTRGS